MLGFLKKLFCIKKSTLVHSRTWEKIVYSCFMFDHVFINLDNIPDFSKISAADIAGQPIAVIFLSSTPQVFDNFGPDPIYRIDDSPYGTIYILIKR